MTPEELLSSLGTSDAQACRAVRACAEHMRRERDGDLEGLAAALIDLARRASAEVRQAVADACDAFPDPFFDEAQDLFAKDPDDYVQTSARMARERRARARAEKAKRNERSRLAAERMKEVKRHLGKEEARQTEAAVRAEAEEFVSRLFHELGRSDGSVDRALAGAKLEASKPRPSGPALLAQLRRLEDLVAFDRSKRKRARLWASRATPVFVQASVREMIASAGDTVARVVPAAKIAIDVQPPDLAMHADRFALAQALENLMKNAAEAYPEGAEAEVRVVARAVERGARIEIAVIDRGVGMSEEQQENLYVSFGSQKKDGTGLGMLIARKMVFELHRGEIRVESARGEGTTMTMLLPATQEKVSR